MAKTIDEGDLPEPSEFARLPPGFVQVKLPSGAPYQVHEVEQDYFENRVRLYTENNEFSHVSDMQDLDRVLIYELFILRYGMWSMRQQDYWGTAVDEAAMQKSIKEFSMECRQIKGSLGLDKTSRDKAKGVDSPAAYIANLGVRARAFGYKRNAEFNKMIELGMQLRALTTLYNNCLASETVIVTREGGLERIGDLSGQVRTLLDGNGGWVPCTIHYRGQQSCRAVTLRRGHQTMTVHATGGHKWFTRKYASSPLQEVTTHELKVGWRIPSMYGTRNTDIPSPWGIAQGFTFGDGHQSTQPTSGCEVRLCGDKDAAMLKWFPLSNTRAAGDGTGDLFVSGLPRGWKEQPDLTMDTSFLLGWLAGYFAADGSVDAHGFGHLDSVEESNIRFAEKVAVRLSIPTTAVTRYEREGFNGREAMWRLSFPVGAFPEDFLLIPAHVERAHPRQRGPRNWIIESIGEAGERESVFCPIVPTTHSFVLGGNVLTGNCDEEERREQRISAENIISWIENVFFKEYDELDRQFRQDGDPEKGFEPQIAWIRDQ